MFKLAKTTACIAVGIFSFSSVFAADDFYEEIPMVTGVSNFPQKISLAPSAVSIITKEMIRAAGVVNVHDIFRMVPGFDAFNYSGSFGGVSYGNYPSNYPNNLEIKLDGLSIYEVFLNTTNWNSLGIDVEDIEYIEVVRGANAAVDGANSFTGSINIVTTSPLEKTHDVIRARVGSHSEQDVTLQLNGFNATTAYEVTLKNRQHDGFADFEGQPVNDALDSQSARIRAIFAPTLQDSFDLQFGYADSDIGMTAGGKEDTADETERYTMVSSYVSATWRRERGTSQYQFRLYRTENSVEYFNYLGPFSQVVGLPPQVFYDDFPYADFDVVLDTRDQSSHRLDAEFRHYFTPHENAKLSWGLGARHDQATSYLFFTSDEPVTEHTARAFLNTEWSWQGLTANFGSSYETTNIDGHALSLRFSANYPVGEHTTLRFARNNVERGPSLMQANEFRTLGYEGYVFDISRLSAEDISNESSRVTELGIYSQLLGGKMTLDAKIYREKARHLIEVYSVSKTPLDFDQRIAYRDNTTDVDVDGAELAISYSGDRWQVWGQMSYRDMQGQSVSDYDDVGGLLVLTGAHDMSNAVPGLMGSVLVQRDLAGNASIAMNVSYRDDVAYRLGGILPSATTVDLTLRKEWPLGEKHLSFALLAHNLFDRRNLDFQAFNVLDRRVYARAELQF
jgi:iron complex outermembrane receptor protein